MAVVYSFTSIQSAEHENVLMNIILLMTMVASKDIVLAEVSVGGLDLVLAAKDISQPLVPFGVTEIVRVVAFT